MDELVVLFLNHLSIHDNASPLTVDAYGRDIRQCIKFIEARLNDDSENILHQFTRNMLSEFLYELTTCGIGRRSLARKLSAIKTFCAYLVREGHLDRSPAADMKTPRYDRSEPTFLSEEEITNVLAPPPSPGFNIVRDLAIVEFFYSTGIRLAEFQTLNVNEIQFYEERVRVLGKGRKERIVPVGTKSGAGGETVSAAQERAPS